MTKLLSRQKYFVLSRKTQNKHCFVVFCRVSRCALSRQTLVHVCRDISFVATKMILVVAPVNDKLVGVGKREGGRGGV